MQKGFINIFVLVGIIIVAGTVGFFVFVKKPTPTVQQTPTPAPSIMPTTKQTPVTQEPTPITTASNDENVNWETYHNEKFRFEVKYPPGWEVFEMSDRQKYGREGATLDSPARQSFGGVHTPSDINLVVKEKSTQTSLEKFISEDEDGWYSRYTVEEITTIGGKSARYVKSVDYRPANVIFIDNGHYVLVIPFNLDETYPNMPDLKIYRSIINKIRFY